MEKIPELMRDAYNFIEHEITKKPINLKHLIVNTTSFSECSKKNNTNFNIVSEKAFNNFKFLTEFQTEFDIPILTISLKISTIEERNFFLNLLAFLNANSGIHKNQVKIFIIGKWYEFSSNVVEEITKIMSNTKEYDRYFLNLCINYDGQEELLEGFKILLRKCLAEKINPETIDKSAIKENLYTSYFIPPDLVIEPYDRFLGTMLWDSSNTHIYFLNKDFIDADKKDFKKAIEHFNNRYSE